MSLGSEDFFHSNSIIYLSRKKLIYRQTSLESPRKVEMLCLQCHKIPETLFSFNNKPPRSIKVSLGSKKSAQKRKTYPSPIYTHAAESLSPVSPKGSSDNHYSNTVSGNTDLVDI